MSIGEKLKALRKQNRMTLEDVANYLHVGRATVLKYENGMITNIPSDKIEQLAVLFNTSPAYLMGWTDDNPDALPDQPLTPEARILAKGIDKLPQEQREQALAVIRAMFIKYADYFEKENDEK